MKAVSVAALCAAVALLAALGSRSVRESVRSESGDRARRQAASTSVLRAPCPPGALPDDGVCIPVPEVPRSPAAGAPERIPRRPDRQAEYGLYALPVPATSSPSVEEATAGVAGADAGVPVAGVLVRVQKGTALSAVNLEGQDGNARVVVAGPAGHRTLVSVHTVREHGRQKEYLVVLSNLALPSPLAPHAELPPGTPLGVTTRDVLGLDVRVVRAGTDVWSLPPDALTSDASSISVDPRNVLRVRGP